MPLLFIPLNWIKKNVIIANPRVVDVSAVGGHKANRPEIFAKKINISIVPAYGANHLLPLPIVETVKSFNDSTIASATFCVPFGILSKFLEIKYAASIIIAIIIHVFKIVSLIGIPKISKTTEGPCRAFSNFSSSLLTYL